MLRADNRLELVTEGKYQIK